MLRREQHLVDTLTQSSKPQPSQESSCQKVKISNLAPYLSEIQRRKKQRQQELKSKKLARDNSSKSFRIKEKSVTSLQKELIKRGHLANRPQPRPKDPVAKQRRTQSVARHHEFQLSKTIDSENQPRQQGGTTFFDQLYAKMKNRAERPGKERRRKQFETAEQRSRSEQDGNLNMYKINFGKADSGPAAISKSEKIAQAVPLSKKKNFRRNKYEMQSSELAERREEGRGEGREEAREERREEDYSQMNKQMDRLAAYQNQAFVKARKRELQGGIQRSTEKYLNYESYRRPSRSKNEIEIYVSGLPNPSLQKASKSTNEQSASRQRFQLTTSLRLHPTTNPCLQYDFDFNNEEGTLQHKEQQDEDIVAEEAFVLKQQDAFEQQRRKVEIQFFNKAEPQLDWSEDQCKVDDI